MRDDNEPIPDDDIAIEDFRKLLAIRAQIRELTKEYDCFVRKIADARDRLDSAKKRYAEALGKIARPIP